MQKVIKPNVKKKRKLSERLAGCVSLKKANLMRKELTEMRNEWQRDI